MTVLESLTVQNAAAVVQTIEMCKQTWMMLIQNA